MTDREVLTALLESAKHLDLQTPDAVETLTTKLEAHTPNFAKMSTKDLAKLSTALRDFGDARLDNLRGRVDTALASRIEDMTRNPPVAQPGATRAGVRAAYVDALSSLKEDVETLSLLATDSNNLLEEDRPERRAAIVRALPNMIAKLAEVMRHGTDEKSPRIIAKAVELARLAHGTLLELDPQQPSDLEEFLADALRTHDPRLLREAEYVVMGTGENEVGKLGLRDESNAVSIAVKRQVNDAATPSNQEARNVQLFRRALGSAIRPKWKEPTGHGNFTTSRLFGDGKVWPTDEAKALKAELATGKFIERNKEGKVIGGRTWDDRTRATCKELLTLFEGFLALSTPNRMTQQEAERLTTPLWESLTKHRIYDSLGNMNMWFDLDLPSLEALDPVARAVKLREMIAPARIAVQRRILGDVNTGRSSAARNWQLDQDQKTRMAKNIEARLKEKEEEERKKAAAVAALAAAAAKPEAAAAAPDGEHKGT